MKKFFFVFIFLSGGLVLLYLVLTLTPYLLKGISMIPLNYFVIYALGSIVALGIMSLIVRNKKVFKILLMWLVCSIMLATLYGVILNWNSIVVEFEKVLPLKFILGFIVCFVICLVSIFASKILSKKKTTKNNSNEEPKQE